MPTPLSMGKAPAPARPTQIRPATQAAAKSAPVGAGGRALHATGVYGQTGKLPGVSPMGGGPITPAAMLPTPLPVPGNSTTKVAFDKASGLFEKALRRHAAKQRAARSVVRSAAPPSPAPVRGPDALLDDMDELWGPPRRGPAPPAPAPAASRVSFEDEMTAMYGPSVIKGPGAAVPPPGKPLIPPTDDELFGL